ncbi:hypothetical protein HDF18_08380 [Mucilaginibacter sp. X5P1]|uniref:hypothetical protein n=1 Tax=Mucilaginibacter sp. X5P1 TaxID=2723088 RepID=UPI00160A384F|nr:hypothetical protein [Mucilaginibacter sp. X5P1]MBB6137673.1 hypothetical protein [Mucilaginibacter sp. X5P1]
MSEIKSLADQLRNKISGTDAQPEETTKSPKVRTTKSQPLPPILEQLRAHDLADHKSMVHTRFKNPTAHLLHHFKMATGIEVNKVVGYAVEQFIEQHPEIKTIVKQYLQKLEI